MELSIDSRLDLKIEWTAPLLHSRRTRKTSMVSMPLTTTTLQPSVTDRLFSIARQRRTKPEELPMRLEETADFKFF